MTQHHYTVSSEQDLASISQALATILPQQCHIHLCGNLGAGKTTLTRYLLQAMGHKGAVKSPTYTLVETYLLDSKRIYHFDLYRINDPEELNFIGIEDFLSDQAIWLIEWADRAQALLPHPDIMLSLTVTSHTSRDLQLTARSEAGHGILAAL